MQQRSTENDRSREEPAGQPQKAEGDEQARSVADAVARRSYGRLVAFLAARTHNVAAAEDALSEAFAAALADWPLHGCPANPEAWLLTVARRRWMDVVRKRQSSGIVDEEIDLQQIADVLGAERENAEIPDRRLALMFACAHPAIEESIRAPLILQAILGLDAATIASAFLTSPAAMGKRLVRAKSKIREAGVPFRIPEREELAGRLDTVLDAIYAAFGEGWSDADGSDATRRDLTAESLFLARLVVEMLPDEPEALGLLALMLHAEARRRGRRNQYGEYIPLSAQNYALWDAEKIGEAEALLRRAGCLGAIGRYQLEAAIQSAHVARCRSGQSNWFEVVQLYDALLSLTASPVVAINRALAIAELKGPQSGLDALPDSAADPRLAEYQPWWAARADLLSRAGMRDESLRAYEIAIGLESDPAVRQFLEKRRAAL
ncbi:RNA polymerase sigma factor [Paracidobacterium acidisoli]|uniref:RNA polymerase subunit sigma-70 n=1 Tax=Paracidobacterium acidisoli TaxID=2303751 RepID=A0A372IJA4_9BACT|nr:RNA polymerase subunit sigma-70 [Paracidobacterium acidisoli]